MSLLIEKARQALESARLLLDHGDAIGAANRVYYAVFDAMRASIKHRTSIDVKEIKTHHGIFRLFERHVLAAKLIDSGMARIIYKSQELRWSGDYGIPVQVRSIDVEQALGPAKAFVDACAEIVIDGKKRQ